MPQSHNNGTVNLPTDIAIVASAAASASKRSSQQTGSSSSRRPVTWHSRPAVFGTGICLGLVLLLVGVTISAVFPGIFRRRIESSMPLVNGSVTFKSWNSPGAPIYMQFWLFNVTNPEQFISGQAPLVRQVGPFTYAEARVKLDVRFGESNGTLVYRQATYYHFRRDLSCCWEDEPLTGLNMAYVGLTYKLRFSSKFARNMLNKLLVNGKHSLLVHRTAREFLWGYKDSALATLAPVAALSGININPFVGLFAGKNGSEGGEYSVFTGATDIRRLAEIASWNGADKLSYWSSPHANMINGTDGAMFPPFVSKSDRLYLFSSDICRSIYLTYTGDLMLHGAVPLYRFQAPAEMFMNSTLNPDNAGFCLNGVCLDSGALNLSSCRDGAPAVMSQPHFYQAAAQYQGAVLGLSPRNPEFDTVLDVEPNTGLVMRAAKKLQVNMAVFPVEAFSEFDSWHNRSRSGPLLMPIMWLNESAELDPESASKFRAAVLTPAQRAVTAQWCLITVGLALLLLSCVAAALFGASRRQQRRDRGKLASSCSKEDAIRFSEVNPLTEPSKVPSVAA